MAFLLIAGAVGYLIEGFTGAAVCIVLAGIVLAAWWLFWFIVLNR
jgi:hypothetical protein